MMTVWELLPWKPTGRHLGVRTSARSIRAEGQKESQTRSGFRRLTRFERPTGGPITMPDTIDIERILDKRKDGRRVQYFIKWKNYDDSENTAGEPD